MWRADDDLKGFSRRVSLREGAQGGMCRHRESHQEQE